MEKLSQTFEKEVRTKICQKADSYKQEEMLLHRTFKYFDYLTENEVDFSQFQKVMQRLGITSMQLSDLQRLFDYYIDLEMQTTSKYNCVKRSSRLNYTVFTNRILNPGMRGKFTNKQQNNQENTHEPQMVSSKGFQRALSDLVSGIKKLDLLMIIDQFNQKLSAARNVNELSDQFILEAFLTSGLHVRFKVCFWELVNF